MGTRALARWLGAPLVLLGGCVAGEGGVAEVGGATEALTYSDPTAEFPYVGLLEVTRGGSQFRCGATLVGRRTILTAANCIDGAITNPRFQLSANDRWYGAQDPLVPSTWPNFERVTADFGQGPVEVTVTTNDIGIMRLTTDPDLSIERGSLTEETPDDSPSDPYLVLGVESDGDVIQSEHDDIGVTRATSIWFGEEDVGFGRGGIAESGDFGAPTIGQVSTGLFGFSGGLPAVSGVHAMKIARGTRIPWDVMVDTRVDAWVSSMSNAANGDVCVDGRHEDGDSEVRCAGGEDSSSDPICGDGAIEGTEQCDDDNTRSGDGCSSSCRDESGWSCRDEPSRCVEDDGRVVCGDGFVEGTEECDDDNTRDDDGCDSRCREESGWTCRFEPSECAVGDGIDECGNGRVEGNEECDDGDRFSGDGCDRSCQEETGWRCDRNEPSRCTEDGTFAECGDGRVDREEECDDGGRDPGDGCDGSCREESGWRCSGDPSRCDRDGSSACGDGILDTSEECDDANRDDRDGCSASCRVEAGWTCRRGQPSECLQDQMVPTGSTGSSSGAQCTVGPYGAGGGAGAWWLATALALLVRRRAGGQ